MYTEGYSIVEANRELSGNQPVLGGSAKHADKLLEILVDRVNRTIHLEFQSTYDKGMARRMFEYGLRTVKEPSSIDKNGEVYELPTSILVNVRPQVWTGPNTRTLKFCMGSGFERQEVALRYPVMNIADSMPEVVKLMNASTMEAVDAAVRELDESAHALTGDAMLDDMFRWACVLVASPQSFDEGVLSASVEKGVSVLKQNAQWWGTSYIEKGRQEGIEKGRQEGRQDTLEEVIGNLMDNFGWTREKAMKAVGRKQDGQGLGPSKMSL